MMVMNLKFAYKMCVIWVSPTLRVSGFVPFFFGKWLFESLPKSDRIPCTSLEAVFINVEIEPEPTTLTSTTFVDDYGIDRGLPRSQCKNMGLLLTGFCIEKLLWQLFVDRGVVAPT